jgi:hypothetical protein
LASLLWSGWARAHSRRSLRHEGDALASAATHLLDAWSTLRDEDEIHLLVSGDSGLCLPEGVVTHQLSTHALTRAAAAWHQCRSLRPDVILGFVPSVDPTAGPRHRRGRIGARRADATVSISSRLRPDLVSQTAHLHSQPLRILAAPGATLMALSGSSTLEHGRGGPHLLVVDDTVAERLGRERATWSDMAGRLRTALLDTMAMSSWRDRRFKVRPATAPSTTAIPLPLAPAAAGRSRARVHRSARWIGGVSAATLTLSAVSAASVNLVLPVHSPPHSAPAPSVTTPVVTGQVTSPPAVTPTTLAPSITSATSPTAPSVTTTTSGAGVTTNTSAGTNTTSPALAPVGGPTLTLPIISLPSIQLPTLPLPALPTLTCSPTTTTTSPLQLINPCALPLTGSTLGGL